MKMLRLIMFLAAYSATCFLRLSTLKLRPWFNKSYFFLFISRGRHCLTFHPSTLLLARDSFLLSLLQWIVLFPMLCRDLGRILPNFSSCLPCKPSSDVLWQCTYPHLHENCHDLGSWIEIGSAHAFDLCTLSYIFSSPPCPK